MSHLFTLQPNLTMLDKYGYEYLSELEIDAIQTTAHRVNTENKFRSLVQQFKIADHYDTLLYISLVESNNADIKENHRHYNYHLQARVKELALLLLLFNPEEKHKPINIKVSSLVNVIKLTDTKLINRIGKTLRDAVESGDFNTPILSEKIFDFTANEDGDIIGGEQRLDYDKIRQYANQTIRKPGVRERNRYLASFLFRVLNFLNHETNLTSDTEVKFSSQQLSFLFELTVLLGWINPDNIQSDAKDYMHTLLSNYIKPQ